MKHSDFDSIALEDVLLKILNFCQEKTQAQSVHWLSATGLNRVHDSSEENWYWAFAATDVIGSHMWSQPAADLFSLYQMWTLVDKLYARPWSLPLKPKLVREPIPRFVMPVYDQKDFLGLLVLDRPKGKSAQTIRAELRSGLQIAAKYLRFAYDHQAAKNLSHLDDVTGLYNQRYLPRVLEHEMQRSKRDNSNFSLLFLDIDYFKMVNDGRGHWVGSKLLIELGRVLRDLVRAYDYTFRYGGDEFIVVLSGAGQDMAQKVAERIRKCIEQQAFIVEGQSLNLTVSIGVATFPDHGDSVSSLIQIADQAMYYAKRKSRNVVFLAG